MKIIKIFPIILAAALLSCCAQDTGADVSEIIPEKSAAVAEEPKEDAAADGEKLFYITRVSDALQTSEDFSLSPVEDKISPSSGVFEFKNGSDKTASVGYNYSLYLLDENGSAYSFDGARKAVGGGYEILPGESSEITVDFEVSYGMLPDGKYLIYILDTSGEAASAEFEIGSGEFDFGGAVLTEPEDGSLGFNVGERFEREDLFINALAEMKTVSASPTEGEFSITNNLPLPIYLQSSIQLCTRSIEDNGIVFYGITGFDEPAPYESAPEEIAPGESLSFPQYWGNLLGISLPDGDYTVFKYFSCDGETYLTYADFTVSEYGINAGFANVPTENIKPETETDTENKNRLAIMPLKEDYCPIEAEITADNVTPLGMSITVKNNTGEELVTDGRFELNVAYENDVFTFCDYYGPDGGEPKNYPVCGMIYSIPDGDSLTLEINWAEILGELPDGEYIINFFTDSGTVKGKFSIGTGATSLDDFDVFHLYEGAEKGDSEYENYYPLRGSLTYESPYGELKSEDRGLQINLSDITNSGAKVAYLSDRDENVMYGAAYGIEKKIGGKWYHINCDPSAAFPMTSLWIEPQSDVVIEEKWDRIYKMLPAGEYRYVADFYIHDRAPVVPEEDLVILGAEFVIE